MMPELTLSGGEAVVLSQSSLRKFKGVHLPGSEYWLAERVGFVMHIQQYQHAAFSIGYYLFSATKDVQLFLHEHSLHWRLEMVLEGELITGSPGDPVLLKAGEYRMVHDATAHGYILNTRHCKYFSASLHLLREEMELPFVGSPDKLRIPRSMHDLVEEILQNRFQENLLPFYYENCVRELFFLHAARMAPVAADSLTDAELVAVYEAERIIRENLHQHFSIQELARKTGTNEYKLKKDFRAVFEVGLFGRLVQLRMQHAKLLLETTSMPVTDVAEQAGYETLAGFITAFKRRYGLPPREWRLRRPDPDSPPLP
ncbi:MAG: AraC family transcriptional regulator, partial [Chitinophagaceae bacterium]